MSEPIIVIPEDFKLPAKVRKQMEDAGYIILHGDPSKIKVLEPTPILPTDELVQLMAEAMNNAAYPAARDKFGELLMNRLASGKAGA